MRLYKDFQEAEGEIARDLKEMGTEVQNDHMQDKQGSFPTMELTNYGYTVLEPDEESLKLPDIHWLRAEWSERQNGINGVAANPGHSYLVPRDSIYWPDFMEYNGKPIPQGSSFEKMRKKYPKAAIDPLRFAYSYPERFAMADQVWQVIRQLRVNPNSRQCFISIWDPTTDPERLGVRRVPCTLGYHVMLRDGKLNITYMMRSCDFVTHWRNDVYLSMKLLRFISSKVGIPVGTFAQFINSFHVYKSDVKDVY